MTRKLTNPEIIDPYAGVHQARCFKRGVVYHTVSRTHSGLFLLRPDLEGLLKSIVAGVHAYAKQVLFPEVDCFASTMLSNHWHMLLAVMRADPRLMADFMRFVKSEVTRRWKREIGWNGSIWTPYKSTAIITPAGEQRALKYVLSQGVKENLVARPEQWPGFHCAKSLATGTPVEGEWLLGTDYQRARHAQLAKPGSQPVYKRDYTVQTHFSFEKLPQWSHLSDSEYQAMVQTLIEEVIDEREAQHPNEPPLGVEKICEADPMTQGPVVELPWYENRRHMIVWDNLQDPRVKEYIKRYRSHQSSFRKASIKWRNKRHATQDFPEFCWVPGIRPRPISHMEQNTS